MASSAFVIRVIPLSFRRAATVTGSESPGNLWIAPLEEPSPERTMFDLLLESRPRRIQNPTRGLTSLGLHGLALGAALAATRPGAISRQIPLEAPISIQVHVPPIRKAEVGPSTVVPAPPRAPAWQPEVITPTLAPTELPAGLPSILDLVRGPGKALEGLALDSGSAGHAEVATAELVDAPVVPLEQPTPRYPPVLAQAGISGWVELSYVVDTLGQVEPASVDVLSSTHPAFAAASRAAVLASRFRPATLRGRLVRQLVRQRLSFRLDGAR
jgi:TonB family protein